MICFRAVVSLMLCAILGFAPDVSAGLPGSSTAAALPPPAVIHEAFGSRTDEWGSALDRHRANTKEEGPTGLLNEGLRYRDIETGTFLSRDPAEFVDGPNLYAYVGQNPWSRNDPLGLWADVDDGGAIAAGALIGLGVQGAIDIYNGQFSGWDDYSASAIGGAAGGWSSLYVGPFAGGAVGGGVAGLTRQGVGNLTGEREGVDVGELALETALGAAAGKLASWIPGAIGRLRDTAKRFWFDGKNLRAGREIYAGDVAAKTIAIRTPGGNYTNLRPGDAVHLQSTPRTLLQDSSGRYWLQSANGNRITPSGSYDFVTLPNGTIRVGRANTNPEFSTHLGLSGGGEVRYAGSIRFSSNSSGPASRGMIREWSNNSGHYQPTAADAANAGLPTSLFRAYE